MFLPWPLLVVGASIIYLRPTLAIPKEKKPQITTELSLKTTTPLGNGCFSSSSVVLLATGDTVRVPQLKPGDQITSATFSGDAVFSPFLGWLHRDDNLTATFVTITTASGNKISLTPLHLLAVTENVNKSPGMRFANTVRVGDYLWSGGSGLTRVTAVTSRVLKGVYAPLTSTGTLLVDDLLASSYAHLANHEVAHLAFLPYRLFPQALSMQDQFGLTPYLVPVYAALTRVANPLIEMAVAASRSTGYLSFAAAGVIAGLAFRRNKK